ncbi:MAG: tetratricopeptide repeat protein, partial [Myxococcota bacterium]
LQDHGDLPAARQRCEQAMAAQRERDANDDDAMLRLEILLGQVLLAQGELDAADAQLSSGLSRAEKGFGPGHPRAAPLLIALAELRREQARVPEAVALLDRVAALSSTLGAGHHDVVSAVVRRAWLMIDAGDGAAVLPVVREQAAKAGEDLAPIDRFELSFAEAGAQWGQGQTDEARATARQARQRYAKTDGAKPEPLARLDAWLAER